jgi:hypothetical protein
LRASFAWATGEVGMLSGGYLGSVQVAADTPTCVRSPVASGRAARISPRIRFALRGSADSDPRGKSANWDSRTLYGLGCAWVLACRPWTPTPTCVRLPRTCSKPDLRWGSARILIRAVKARIGIRALYTVWGVRGPRPAALSRSPPLVFVCLALARSQICAEGPCAF